MSYGCDTETENQHIPFDVLMTSDGHLSDPLAEPAMLIQYPTFSATWLEIPNEH